MKLILAIEIGLIHVVEIEIIIQVRITSRHSGLGELILICLLFSLLLLLD